MLTGEGRYCPAADARTVRENFEKSWCIRNYFYLFAFSSLKTIHDLSEHHLKWQTRQSPYANVRQQSANNPLFGWKWFELRSPDLWGVQPDAEFYTRFAHEGPEAVRAQFRG